MRQLPSPALHAAFVTALILVLGPGWAPPAAAQSATLQSVEIVPDPLTWQDEARVRVTGSSTCEVSISEPVVSPNVTPPTVSVELELVCSLDPPVDPPVPRSFTVTADVGHLKPRHYVLELENGPITVETPFTVLDRAPIGVDLSAAPYVDDEPVMFEVILFDNEVTLDVTPRADAGVIEVRLERRSDTTLIPTGDGVLSATADAGLLPPGDYDVQVLDVTNPYGFYSLATRSLTVHDSDGCVPSDTELCLGDGRFRVEATWRDFRDRRGDGVAVPLEGREDTGSFWFFNQDNLELTVKVLDGCGVNGYYWVFVSSGSTVEYDVTVTDTQAGGGGTAVRVYGNDLGQTPALIPDTAAFANCP